MPTVHVHLSYDNNPAETDRRFRAGLVPDRIAYGFHHAEAVCDSVTYSQSPPESAFARFIRKGFVRVFGFDLVHAWRNRRLVDASDAVWTMLETEHLALSLLSALRPWRRRKPVLAQSVWLFDRLQHRRMWLAKALARRHAVLMTHSEACLPTLRRHFPECRAALMHFGISADTFALSPPQLRAPAGPIHVVAAGNDRTRDWDTLLAAFGDDERFRVSLVCQWVEPRRLHGYGNVTHVPELPMAAFRDLYASADVVVVPMHPNSFSGITVALEAIASGTMVVSARTGGVPTYFDASEVGFYEPGDAAGLRECVLASTPRQRRECVQRAQARFQSAGYSTRAMVGRYKALTDLLWLEAAARRC